MSLDREPAELYGPRLLFDRHLLSSVTRWRLPNPNKRLMMRTNITKPLIAVSVSWAALCAVTTASAECRQLPALFKAGRVIVSYPTAAGITLKLFTDTGGGGSLIAKAVDARIPMKRIPTSAATMAELGPQAELVEMLAPQPNSVVPAAPNPAYLVPNIMPISDWPESLDGMLGQNWFTGRVWTWDYAAAKFFIGCAGKGASVPLGLPSAAQSGSKQFPRIVVEIAGEPISMLLDTGATTWLTDNALKAVGDAGPAVRAASMMSRTRIERWHRDHPDWRIIDAAQRATGARMIEVSDVRIAGIEVGPVWFTERPDANFSKMMSSMMDATVEGAIGGNAFAKLRMTVSYRNKTAWFEKR